MAEVRFTGDWGPPDWSQLQWHRAPVSRCYTKPKAERRVRWLNSHQHAHDEWRFQVGGQDQDGRWYLEWRWVGRDLGVIG
jgi:hypothetical protein